MSKESIQLPTLPESDILEVRDFALNGWKLGETHGLPHWQRVERNGILLSVGNGKLRYGTYGSNLYAVYEPDFTLRKDEPFIYLQNEQCVFDSINKTITIAGKDIAYIYQGIGEHFELLENEKGNLSQ